MQIRALVGAGFLGSHLCEHLLNLGWQVTCLDNEATGTERNIHHLVTKTNFEFVRTDISKDLSHSGPVDYVLHFASPASPPDYLALPIETLEVGFVG